MTPGFNPERVGPKEQNLVIAKLMNEIETIFCKLLKCRRSRLYLDPRRLTLNPRQVNRLEGILKKRIGGAPLQYLVGDTEFMGLVLKVKPGVFIPRPETEVLVDTVIQYVTSHQSPVTSPKILDIGTGSGNIAVSLAKFLENCKITSIDISKEAIDVAKHNASLHGVKNKIDFIHQDFSDFGHLSSDFVPFDIIVSNPPYISAEDLDGLPEDVRHEPALALFAKDNGLYFYTQIEKQARRCLKPQGAIFLEIGDEQSPDLKKIFSDRSIWKHISFVKDNNGIERVAVIIKAHSS
jgi:release factor glutamine methyltransferase